MTARTQEQYLKDAAEKNRREKAEAEAKLRTLCDGTRTAAELASRLGWKKERTRLLAKKLGLPVAKGTT